MLETALHHSDEKLCENGHLCEGGEGAEAMNVGGQDAFKCLVSRGLRTFLSALHPFVLVLFLSLALQLGGVRRVIFRQRLQVVFRKPQCAKTPELATATEGGASSWL